MCKIVVPHVLCLRYPHYPQLTDYVKSTVHSANALVGTCKMGAATERMAVVDPALKVRQRAVLGRNYLVRTTETA